MIDIIIAYIYHMCYNKYEVIYMKKIFCFIICLSVLLVGCAKSATNETQPATTNTMPDTTTEPTYIVPQQEAMYAISVPTVSENTNAEDGTVIFSYTHPNIMLTLPDPDVANKVIIDFLSRIDNDTASVESLCNTAKANYNQSSDWVPYLYSITYSPMRMDQGVLSLFGSQITYSGASHPERLSMSASYDLVTGDVLTLGSIMSAQATRDDFCNLVLQKLDGIKDAKQLYDGYENTVTQRFSQDESQDQDWYFSTNGLCFYFVPYEIAPYSSGVVVVEIPYNELAGLLYDGYFPEERESTIGSIKASTTDETDITQFTQNAELTLDPDGQMVFLHTDSIVWDVRIEYGAWDTSNTLFTPVYTPLFSGTLTPGDAIMIQSNELSTLRLSYFNGQETVVQYFNQSGDDIQLAF